MVERVLSVLEQSSVLAPTHWAIAAGLRDPYDRAQFVAAAVEDGTAPHLLRVRGRGTFSATWIPGKALVALDYTSRGPVEDELASEIVAQVTELAGLTPVDYGLVDFDFLGQPEGTSMCDSGGPFVHSGMYATHGLLRLYSINIFGPRLLKKLGGLPALARNGMPVLPLPNGAARMMLVPEPWTADPRALKAAQRQAMDLLRSSGIFRLPSHPLEPAPNWEPIGGDDERMLH
jgi:hypothetical protein